MKHAPLAATLLAFGVAVSLDAMSAAPRDPLPPTYFEDEPVDPEQPRAGNVQEIEAWLRRLVGSYRTYSGVSINGVLRDEPMVSSNPSVVIHPPQVDKSAKVRSSWMDCAGIGSGPGVHCMWGGVLTEPGEKVEWSGQQDFNGVGMLLQFGINPNASEIQMFTAQTWLAQASAQLLGDTIYLRWVCPNMSAATACQMAFRITVPVDGEYVRLTQSLITSAGTNSRQIYLYPAAAEERASADDPARISLYDKYLERMKRQRGPR